MFFLNKTLIKGQIIINFYVAAYIFYEWSRMFDPRTGGSYAAAEKNEEERR